jgi:TolB protein
MRQPDIAIRAAGAKNLVRLTANRVIEAQPALSPDGRHIAFLRFSRAGGYPRLYVMQVDGRQQRRIASGAWGPVWSPDGTWIAYDGRDGIRIVRSSGRGDQLLVPETRRTSVLRPVWLSDGLHIAFVRASRTGRSAIWTATVHGGGLDPVGSVPRYLDDFDVAPDGQRLVFSGGRRLFVMNIDGTGRRPFGRREKWGIATPAWCRDGRTIVFASRRDRDWDLYAMTTSGRVFAKVTDNLGDDYEPDC